MDDWNGWPAARMTYAFLGAAYLLVWIQVFLYHWRAAFRSKFMYGPVIVAPLAAIAGLMMAYRPEYGSFFVFAFALAALSGLMGTAMHLKGIAAMVGGFNLRNFAMGPPVVLALVFMALGVFGLILHYGAGAQGA